VLIDGARFLPASTTISRVVASVWSNSGALLAGSFEGVAQPSSDALSPMYMCKALVDASQNNSNFDDPTATLLLQVLVQHKPPCICFGGRRGSGGCLELQQ
jgi:hypothetical protein